MAIKNRTGQDLWFDPNKMLPGEMAVSTDAKRVYVAFAPGDVREFAFKDQIPIVGDITPDKLQEAVNNYLNENPVHAGATEKEAKQIELNRQNIENLSQSNTELQRTVDEMNGKLSHIGMIIHSTTLDTMEKVIAIYGGTTWEKIEGMFLLGANDKYKVNSTGGEEEHFLTIDELPSHGHPVTNHQGEQIYHDYIGGNDELIRISSGYNVSGRSNPYYASNIGGSQPHNNMPPYKAVYIWERVE